MPVSVKGICKFCGKPYEGVRAGQSPRKFCNQKCFSGWRKQKVALLRMDISKYPIYTHYPRPKGDYILMADLHAPYLQVDWFEYALDEAKAQGIKKAIIGGDFFNQGAFSHWSDVEKNEDFENELKTCERILELMVAQFEEIIILTAGHEKRFLKCLNFKLKPKRMFKMITDRIGKEIKVSPYSHCLLNNKWKITHPKKGRKKKLSLSTELCTIYHKHIICFHQHYSGITTDVSGKFIACDIGMMADTRKLSYTQIDVDVWPCSVNSFAIIKDDKINLYIDHPNWC